jgi:hypothetical protein
LVTMDEPAVRQGTICWSFAVLRSR